VTVTEIVADVSSRLAGAGIPHVLGGSLASSAWGQMRQTNDADFGALLTLETLEGFLTAFTDPYYVGRLEAEEALASEAPYRTVQIMHMDEVFKIDLFVIGGDEYSRSEIARSRRIEIVPGKEVPFAAPENIVVQKLRWFDLGSRVSDRQWNDIVQVLEVQRGHLDMEYLRRWTAHFGLEDLLDEAIDQTLE
jgi:hypothetical protein